MVLERMLYQEFVHVHVEQALREIGQRLDRHAVLRVANGGFVVLSEPAGPLTLSMENEHERETERRSAAGSRQRTPGGQGASGGARPSGHTAPVVRADLQAQVEDQLCGLQQQYPGAQLWNQDNGIWLLTRSGLLPRLRQHAIFLTRVSYSWGMVRSWGFWGDPLAAPEWIGPRHTNFPDGSICAFEPTEGIWTLSDPIVKLLDIYSLWAVRHLHLQVFGRWPGRQAVHHPAERVLELRADEYCGCTHGDKLYGECCMPKDLARDRIRDALTFFWRSGGFRSPPDPVARFVRDRKELPTMDHLPAPAHWT
jgi:hypothetical protein